MCPIPESTTTPAQTAQPAQTPPRQEWTVQRIRDLSQRVFGKRPCWLQVKITLALHAKKDVIGVAATGAGKTLSFWLALLTALEDGEDKMVIVITPLNLLGQQNTKQLTAAGLSSVAVTKENNKPETYKVTRNIISPLNLTYVFQDIIQGKYRVVTISPELVNDGTDAKLWDMPEVTARLLYFVFDEGHCVSQISQWGKTFRNQYLYIGNIRYLLPPNIPFYVASATLPPPILRDVSDILHLRPENTEKIIRSNDRPNIHLVVRKMEHAIHTFRDLAFVIPDDLNWVTHLLQNSLFSSIARPILKVL